MKILITGTREPPGFYGIQMIRKVFKTLPEGTIIIQGGAKGVDSAVKDFCYIFGLKCEEYKADWSLGKRGGTIRNTLMLDQNPDKVYAFPRGKSPGTRNCIMQARQRGIEVEVIEL